ncbi:MAG: anhydro-N-acetylmuramic acid kinase [Bacteroidales bacterium]|nr:anhydro-N-acetylmuramic acid kinase [Bacteroidales bacterium]
MKSSMTVAGLMSGTSLDGLDIAIVRFSLTGDEWKYEVLAATTLPYSDLWYERLDKAINSNGRDLAALHADYGRFLGEMVKSFLKQTGLRIDLIASHGHTIFHEPEKGFTFQLGCGASIAANSGITTVSDFRTLDVALGGQGAPLVPVGDKLLFPEYHAWLNLGGFANISVKSGEEMLAWDLAPANMALNYLAEQYGKKYDAEGLIASSGQLDKELLRQFLLLEYFNRPAPKSLGREWFEKEFKPLLDADETSLADKMATVCEFLALILAKDCQQYGVQKMLVSGGGTHNSYLMARIEYHCNTEVVVPDRLTVDYKEAIVFAFLGCLRMLSRPNALKSVTGAQRNSVGGAVYLGEVKSE